MYQLNHVWALSLNAALPKAKLLEKGHLIIKGKKCLVLDPNKAQVKTQLHWLPEHVSDEAIKKALESFGVAGDIVRRKWNGSFFHGVDTTTRTVVLELQTGVTVDSLPQMLHIMGCQVLLDIDGRPPLCLTCKKVGHVRKECRVP